MPYCLPTDPQTDDREWPFCVKFSFRGGITRFLAGIGFGCNCMKTNTLSAAKCTQGSLVSGNIRVIRIFAWFTEEERQTTVDALIIRFWLITLVDNNWVDTILESQTIASQ